jgi:hypothetical protein
MQFEIKLTGITQLSAAFQQAPAISAPLLQRALSASSAILAKYTTKATVPWRTGFLTQSFKAQLEGLSLTWFPTADYAKYVEFGTRPHAITAVNGQALVWYGMDHPVRNVWHPGTRPDDFMGRIMESATPEIEDTFGQALNAIVAAIAKKTV